MDSLTRRRINLSDSSTRNGSTVHSTVSYTTSRSPAPPFSPVDRRYPAELQTHTIGKRHAIVGLWENSLRVQVMEKVRRRGDEWQAVDVLRRGWSERAEQCDATVVITIKESAEVSDWAATVREVEKICNEQCGELVQVELLVANLGRSADLKWDDSNWMGSSIGVAGDPKYGTLGGYLNLRKNGEVMSVVMTCHHVLSSGHEGILAPASGSHRANVCQPSDVEHEKWMDELQSNVASVRQSMERMDEETGGFGGERQRQRQLDIIEQLEARLQEGQTFDRNFGEVFASSGFKVASRGCSLDWGLIRLNADRSGTNELPPEAQYKGIMFKEVAGLTRLMIGDKVVKGGADTGWTRGRFNEIKSDVHLEDGPLEGTREFCCVSTHGVAPFSRKGDSGAWVLTQDGALGGLLLAGHNAGNWSYVTPIEHVLKDIEESLSCSVSLPEPSS